MFDNATVSIPCPTCGHEVKKTFSRIRMHDHFVCGSCGKTVGLVVDQLIDALKGSGSGAAAKRAKGKKKGKA